MSKKVIRVVDNSGNLTQGYAEECIAFREHFAELMHADIVLFSSLIVKDRDPDTRRFQDVNVERAWKEIPSPTDTLHSFCRAKEGEAPGEDIIVDYI